MTLVKNSKGFARLSQIMFFRDKYRIASKKQNLSTNKILRQSLEGRKYRLRSTTLANLRKNFITCWPHTRCFLARREKAFSVSISFLQSNVFGGSKKTLGSPLPKIRASFKRTKILKRYMLKLRCFDCMFQKISLFSAHSKNKTFIRNVSYLTAKDSEKAKHIH